MKKISNAVYREVRELLEVFVFSDMIFGEHDNVDYLYKLQEVNEEFDLGYDSEIQEAIDELKENNSDKDFAPGDE